ncbi:hypothetical protein Q0N51_10115 [Priestia megaterium]|uniref:hypothetical protein n=1 Tax=Priestia megaterium TaxID=1404 RepID=UPI003458803D
MEQVVKRLAIPSKVSKKLFVFSGNQCAFKGCTHKIVSDEGTYIAEICHIEAANEGGQRFNPTMTNEQRADYPNLLLLCHEHHKETDNVEKYTVDVLKNIKEEHENKFKNILNDISASALKDITKGQVIFYPSTLSSFNEELKWGNEEGEIQATLEIMKIEIAKLQKLTKKTRSVFCTMIERSKKNKFLVSEIQEVLGISDKEYFKQISFLTKDKLIYEVEFDDDNYYCELNIPEGWEMWRDVKKYCKQRKIDLEDVIVDLRFDSLG